ncbi:unnamed protein product [Calypogeia fissa]
MGRSDGRILRNWLHVVKSRASGQQGMHGLIRSIGPNSASYDRKGRVDCGSGRLLVKQLKPSSCTTDTFSNPHSIGHCVRSFASGTESSAFQTEVGEGADEQAFRGVAGASSEEGAEKQEEQHGRGGFQQPWQGARVPLNAWQHVAVAAGSAVGAALNPARADLVAALGETTGSLAFRRILARMRRSYEGQKVLLERPRVTSTSMARAWDMPSNTLGAAYAKFMGDRNFSPDDRPPVRFVDSEDLAYAATRYREVHDFWHVLFNLPTSVMGELALKMVEFHQTGIPMCFLSVAGASWRLKPKQRNYLFTHYAPWALRAGISASDLMCIYYEQHLHEDLEEVRKSWGIIPAPPLPKN